MRFAVLGLGALYHDTLLTVPYLPSEDSKLRATGQSTRLGGNLINTFRVLAASPSSSSHDLLTLDLHFCGAVGSIESSSSLLAIFERSGITPHLIHRAEYAGLSSAYIILSAATGSRTIISSPPIPDPSVGELLQHVPASPIDWIHVEGRNCVAVKRFLDAYDQKRDLLQSSTILSVDLERPREGLDVLWGCADVVFVSKEYAKYALDQKSAGTDLLLLPELGEESESEAFVERFLAAAGDQMKKNAIGFLTLGARGSIVFFRPERHPDEPNDDDPAMPGPIAWGSSCGVSVGGWKWVLVPPRHVEKVVETVGAGDTFIAGVIHARLSGASPVDCARLGNRLAAAKCQVSGFEGVWNK